MKSFILILSLFISGVVFAQAELINSLNRPKISEVLKYHQDYAAPIDAMVTGGRFNLKYFRDSIEDGAPQFIANLEKAFPNAKFVFMGRDTQLIADATDAFYLSIGQPDRVVQLGVSKPTLVGLDTESVLKYLEYFGIELNKLSENTPIVLVDTISTGEIINGSLVSGRQGRFILQTVYKKWMDEGHDPKDLLGKFNMIGMQVSTFQAADAGNLKRYKKISNLAEVKSANQAMLQGKIDTSKLGVNLVIPLIKDTIYLFNEAGYDHFTATWHDRFLPPISENGRLIPRPGQAMDVRYKNSVLWMQHQIIDMVQKPGFNDRVFSEAKKLGVTFKVQPAVAEVIPEKVIIDYNAVLEKQIQQKINPLLALNKETKNYSKVQYANQKIRLTDNGSVVLSVLASESAVQASNYFETSFNQLVSLYEENKIGVRDFRRIMTHIIGLKPIAEKNFKDLVQSHYKNVLPLEIFLGRETERKQLMSLGGIAEDNYRQLIDFGKLKMSCQFVYVN